MAMHPPAPQQLSELVDAWARTAQNVLDLASTCSDADFALPTTCEGWSVKDHIAHVAGLEASLDGHVDPDVDVPDYPWLRHKMGRFMEQAVEVRRSWSGAEVVAELQRVIPRRLETLRDPSLTDETPLTGPFGQRPARALVTNRTMDVWCHEQDLRDALGRPGDLDSPAAAVFLQAVLGALPRQAVEAGLPVGTAVIVESTGPLQAREGVRIVPGTADDAPVAEPRFSGSADEAHDSSHEQVTTIRLSTEALARAGAGRVSVDDLHYTVEGDEDVARRLLAALAVTP
ncbi:maleylpyruvate isomerase family mycothiol-dependent enzyme [Luteipulveratus halotolerans]|uniref:Mycothiol-dependent maleylpyruvate isomerase metal-binding domain-containing protein n=1 Tax=Luteipulveratus halotolerans TaxID=1631356 RepID=A0A0L6CMQ4_9MICO|nr:maleylpyruvate isomerase family mycothiol-dependent enzyme [Luteipulveratus halotolerans]KNX39071.1 hypothetical protein VV01_21190 [Luteipulveratus halotolerans]